MGRGETVMLRWRSPGTFKDIEKEIDSWFDEHTWSAITPWVSMKNSTQNHCFGGIGEGVCDEKTASKSGTGNKQR